MTAGRRRRSAATPHVRRTRPATTNAATTVTETALNYETGPAFGFGVLPGASEGFDLIKNFTLTNGDVLNLGAALHETGWNAQASTLGAYLKVTSGGGNTTLSIAPSGSGGAPPSRSSPGRAI